MNISPFFVRKVLVPWEMEECSVIRVWPGFPVCSLLNRQASDWGSCFNDSLGAITVLRSPCVAVIMGVLQPLLTCKMKKSLFEIIHKTLTYIGYLFISSFHFESETLV